MPKPSTTSAESASRLFRAMFDHRSTRADVTRRTETTGHEDIFLYHARFEGPSHASGVSDRHVIVIHLGRDVAADCRVGTETINHHSGYGNVTVIPAEMEWSADLAADSEKIVLGIPTERVAVAALQAERPSATLRAQLRGYDPALFSIVRDLRDNAGAEDAEWHFLTDELASRLAEAVDAAPDDVPLPSEKIARLNAYLGAHLDEAVLIDRLAEVTGTGRSGFPRIFRRTFGISPHQYVVRLRLRHARRRMAAGRSIAEAAFDAGFAHQSHFNNWLRRLYGVTPGAIARTRG